MHNNGLPLVPTLCQIHPIHTIPSYFVRFILILLSNHLVLPSGLLTSDLHIKTVYEFLFSQTRATCPAHLILLDLMSRLTFADKTRS